MLKAVVTGFLGKDARLKRGRQQKGLLDKKMGIRNVPDRGGQCVDG